jgi:RNA-directed DNA polymerase
VDKLLYAGYTDVVDADLSKYFDTIPHAELMQCVARRIVDKHLLHLLPMWLKVPVEEREEKGRKRLTGGRDNDRGTPQGGVVSPLLANQYMNRLLKGWPRSGHCFAAMATDQTGRAISGANRVLCGRLRDSQSRTREGGA